MNNPKRGEFWKGKIWPDVVFRIIIVSKKYNTVKAKIEQSGNSKDIGKYKDYILESFNQYYELI